MHIFCALSFQSLLNQITNSNHSWISVLQEYHKVFVNSRHRKTQAGRYTFPVNGEFDHKKIKLFTRIHILLTHFYKKKKRKKKIKYSCYISFKSDALAILIKTLAIILRIIKKNMFVIPVYTTAIFLIPGSQFEQTSDLSSLSFAWSCLQIRITQYSTVLIK